MEVDVVEAGNSAWDGYLDAVPHDVYHRAGYHRFERLRGGGEPLLLVAKSPGATLIWPGLLRPVDIPGAASGRADVTSAYGYSGPLAWGPAVDEAFLGVAWKEFVDAWRARGVVSLFTRFHPVLGNAAVAGGFASPSAWRPGPDGVHGRGETVSVDCTGPDEQARAAYAKPLRKHLENAERLGYVTAEDPQWLDLDAFVRIYTETMDRNGAGAFYRFTAGDFRFLRDALDGRVHLLLTRAGDEVVSGGVFTEACGIVQAHLMATATAHLATSPGKALLDGARRWARDGGHRLLHLGGGRGGRRDSLFRFKREFSARRHPFATGAWVLDVEAYEALVDRHDPAGRLAGEASGFFPRYRAPLPAG